jgi:hypothetical protein
VEDEARLPIEPGAADGEGTAWSGPGASSRRVVHEPSRRGRIAAIVVVAGLVMGGLVLSLGGSGADDRPDEPPQERSERDAYLAAIGGLGRARTFAYHGTIRADGPSQLQPGTWLADAVTVEGAVLLPQSITREVATAVDDGDDGDDGGDGEDGGVVETVTSGATVWSRTAASSSGLADAPWRRVAWQEAVSSVSSTSPPGLESFEPGRLGIARLLDVLRLADDRRSGPNDDEGNRTLLATVPEDGESRELGDLAGAEVELALDESGDISDITLTSTAGDRRLLLELAIERLGEPGLIAASDVGGPVRSGVPVADIAAAGVRPLELSQLPSGWALTSAREVMAGPVDMCGTGTGVAACDIPEGCLVFQLSYNDLTQVLGGRMGFSVLTDDCSGWPDVGADPTSGIPWGQPFQAGSFSGWVLENPAETSGTMSDGDTTIHFSTDLSVADAEAVLATLGPFDAATEPAVLPGIPSSSSSSAS